MLAFSNTKRLTLLALAILAFAQGAAGQYLEPGELYPKSDLVFILAGVMLTFFWYRVDSDQRAYRRTVWLNVSVVALALIALPYYFFRTRGAIRGLVATVVFLGFAVLWSVLAALGGYATYYGLQS